MLGQPLPNLNRSLRNRQIWSTAGRCIFFETLTGRENATGEAGKHAPAADVPCCRAGHVPPPPGVPLHLHPRAGQQRRQTRRGDARGGGACASA